jgi:GT2 family glycosyltransferase
MARSRTTISPAMAEVLAGLTKSRTGNTLSVVTTATAPEYSIIVPTYRRREPLARCLSALGALDYPRDRFEVLIVDDGSPSPPADLLPSLDPSIDARLICAHHAGPAAARNTGAQFARGRHLVFTDDDCAPQADWLSAIDRWMNRADRPLAVGGRVVNILPDNLYASASQGIVDYLYDYYGDRSAPGRFFTSNNLIVPRGEFLEIGGFDEGFRLAGAEDRDFCERWRAEAMMLEYADDVVVHHAHSLGFTRFSRQHFNYGRGAFDLHRSRARRGQRSLRLEPGRFYFGLVAYPVRRSPDLRGLLLGVLHWWSQVAYAAGYFYERLRRGWVVDVSRAPRRVTPRPSVIERRGTHASRDTVSGAI